MIVEREQEIEMFNTQEYWSIDGIFSTIASENSRRKATQEFRAKLVSFNNKKLAKLDISTEAQAKQMCSELAPLSYSAADIEKKQVHRNPAPPFTTSTMQQEASRKLGFGAMRTMRVAQFLYEGVQVDGEKTGLITYMRTDSTNLSKEGVAGMRDFIAKNYGDKYLPKSSRVYKTKAKNAQEAHEAIRPTDISKRPGDLAKFLDKDQLALYELIWKRAIASQMENAVFDQVSVDLVDTAKKHVFRAVGTTQVFDGFLRVYQEGTDEADGSETEHGAHGNAVMHWKGGASANEDERQLPVLQLNEVVSLGDIAKAQHFTQPPPRFTEASIVKRLEELGIGRPSTYAPLIQVLQDRGYAALEKRQFMPSDRGRIVTGFLTNFCRKYVEYDFTAHMEDELDDISNGEIEWRRVMTNFWTEFSQTISSMKDIPITEVINRLEENLALYIFKNLQDRKCDKCGEGVVGLRLSKFGAFLGCNRYPECLNRKSIGADTNAAEEERFEAVELGVDPSDNAKIFLRKGPFGFYVQAETIGKRGKVKIKRITIPQEIVPQNISFQEALFLKGLPKTIGELDGNEVRVSIGRFGPYVCCGDVSASIPKATSIMAVTLDDAISLIKKKLARQTQRQQSKAPKGG
jgi:DNA topoisomerase-1